MPKPTPLPKTLNVNGFAVSEARAAGLSPARLRSSDLDAPYRGVRTTSSSRGIHALAHAYAARLLPGQYFSHETAAVLLGFRMPEGFRSHTLHVSSASPQRAPRIAGVIGHRSHSSAIVIKDWLPLSDPLQTWCALASTMSLDDLVGVGDSLVRRKNRYTNIAHLRSAAALFKGRGCRKLRAAAALVRSDTDSWRETRLRLLVVRAGFPEPEINGIITNSYGAQIARGDLVIRQFRVLLEYDGGHHREDERQFHIDVERLDRIMEERWRVIRVNKYLMARPRLLISKIEIALTQGGWPGYAASR